MAQTDEERAATLAAGRANLAAKRAAAKAAKQAAKAGEPPSPPSPAADSDVMEALKALLQAGDHAKESARLEDQVEELLSRIDFKKFPNLLDNPAIERLLEAAGERKAKAAQSGPLPPGSVVNKGQANETSIAWSWRHLAFLHEQDPEGLPILEVVSPVTRTVGFNELFYTFVARKRVRVYAPFWNILMDSLNMEEENELRQQWFYQLGPWHPTNPNPPPARPDWVLDGGAGSRAAGQGMIQAGAGTVGMDVRDLAEAKS